MKLTCVREKLKERVAQAEKVTGKNISLPILSSILLQVKKGLLIVRATNLNVGVEFTIPAKIEREGEVAVPAGVLSGVLSGLSIGKNIDMELVNDNLVVATEKNTVLVKSFKTDDFPTIPRIEDGKKFELSIEKIVTGVKSVWYASSVSDIKPEIASVYMYMSDKDLVFVATDSFRLAEKKIKNNGVGEFNGVIIPVKNIHEIIRVLEQTTGNCMIEVDTNQISFSTNDIYITSRVVGGIYPDYHQIIPKEFTTNITVLKDDLMNALKLTNIFTDKFNKVNVKIGIKKTSMEISAQNDGVGENMTTVDATVQGDHFDVNFNYRYILDGLQTIPYESVMLKYDAKREVMVIQGVNDPSFTYIVKPMNR